ncbi:MAG: tRNA (N6-isopentenyl adenosine(37)-C2)-methylthiotransferase MiaB [Candidatus Paracaedibacteraceae bacterium]|nr:tRNA (N6-isopentenyl adenosine(37)-C2)-methylthiotransferase MiaB [Candidatus Paracaedibacteraceae bacterium]
MSIIKKLFVKTYGCQMNMYDSDRMIDLLKPLGYQLSDTPENADMIILNTCHIREKAEHKLYSDIGRLEPYKEAKAAKGEYMILAVAGCVAQAEGEEISRRKPVVDMVFGPQSYHKLPEMIAQAHRTLSKNGKPSVLDVDFPTESKFDSLPAPNPDHKGSAFLSVQEGCDKFCTFCVVPYTRGSEFSRPVADILKEAKHLVSIGVKEITLLGQNVTAYHGVGLDDKEWSMGRLLFAMAEVPGLERIRYTTSHPQDMHKELYTAHKDIPHLMPYFHLPVQSGSDKILKAMNRKHTAAEYRDIIYKLREIRPDIALSSDFIVGFPDETDQDFEDTLQLVRDIKYVQAYSFKYSMRPGTPAALIHSQVNEDIKDNRLQILQELLREQQLEFNISMVGKQTTVLLEKEGRHPGQLIGKSPFLQSVYLEAPKRLLGQIVTVEIEGGTQNSLAGKMVTQEHIHYA